MKTLIFIIAFCLFSCVQNVQPPNSPIKVFSFNMRRFDAAKAQNKQIAVFMSKIIEEADVAALQEIIGLDDEAMSNFAGYNGKTAVLGPPEGSGAFYQEQFAFLYNPERVTLISHAVFPDEKKRFERAPMAAFFTTPANSSAAESRSSFIVINCHIKPDETTVRTTAEIALLPEAARYFTALWHEKDVFIVGDFNAGGAYYDGANLPAVFPQASWKIITDNSWDTTVSSNNDAAYDRFIISKSAIEDWTGNAGTIRFDEMDECWRLSVNPAADISDHYPIWAEFSVVNDTD